MTTYMFFNVTLAVMRLGKKKEKERETESRREVVYGVSRLLGSAKNQPFKGNVWLFKLLHIYIF